MISINPDNGDVVAYIGGKNFNESNFDRVRSAFPQSGSSFKPFIYSSGLARSTRRYRYPLQTLREMIGYANYSPTSQHFGVFSPLGLPWGLLGPLQTLREMKGYGLDLCHR